MPDTTSQEKHCSFCGNLLNPLTMKYVQGKGDKKTARVCGDCVEKFYSMLHTEGKPVRSDSARVVNKKELNELSPKAIVEKLDEFCIGQDDFKKDVSLLAYSMINRNKAIEQGVPPDRLERKAAMICAGPSGCGKTHIISTMARIINVPVVICDITGYTSSGYYGSDVDDIVRNLISVAGSPEKAMNGLIVIDEVDKIGVGSGNGSHSYSRGVSDWAVQVELLKLIEGNEYSDVSVYLNGDKKRSQVTSFNTSNITFCAMGAFSNMFEQLSKQKEQMIGFRKNNADSLCVDDSLNEIDEYTLSSALIKHGGLLPEFVSRFTIKSMAKKLTVSELSRILHEPKGSIVKTEYEKFHREGICLTVNAEARVLIAENAYKKGLNARGLNSELYRLLKNVQYEFFGQSNKPTTINIKVKNGSLATEAYWLDTNMKEEKVYA